MHTWYNNDIVLYNAPPRTGMLWKSGRSDLFLQEGQATLQETCSFCEFLKVYGSGEDKEIWREREELKLPINF